MWKRAWELTRKSFGWKLQTLITSIISLIAGLLIAKHFLQDTEMAGQLIGTIAPIGGGLAGVIVLFIFHLIRAPVYIKFEREKEPRLTIVDIVRSHYGEKGHSWELIIKNLGTDRADDCRGTLVDIDFAKPIDSFSMEWWPKNEQLQWAERLPSNTKEFSIPGLESKNLRVIINELSEPQTPYDNIPALYIAYARDELSRGRSALSTGTYFSPTSSVTIDAASSILVISVTSKNREPIYAICYLDRDYSKLGNDYNLILLDENKRERPSIDTYRRMLETLGLGRRSKYDKPKTNRRKRSSKESMPRITEVRTLRRIKKQIK